MGAFRRGFGWDFLAIGGVVGTRPQIRKDAHEPTATYFYSETLSEAFVRRGSGSPWTHAQAFFAFPLVA